ncbi:methyl-accepting chemotaxis protein [Paracoccus pacificus]|uniref:Methyl-accepting chemotaxis protein n=1 Tax=Paracoccus pacificus TaxID=1463598 RepID=A0ABW4R580_9RHOB
MSQEEIIHLEPAQAMAALDQVQCILTCDPAGRILRINDIGLKITGYQRDQLLGQPLTDLLALSDAKGGELVGFWTDLRQGRGQCGEYRGTGRDGQRIYLNASFVPLRDDAGQIAHITCFAVDVTGAKTAALAATRQIDALQRAQAFIEFTPAGEIVTANANFLKVMGYTLEEIQGRHHRMFCDPDHARSPEYELLWDDLSNGRFRIGEFRRVCKGNRPVWIVASYNPILDNAGKVQKIVKYASDVTEAKLAIEELVSGLERMSHGDLTIRLSEKVAGDFAGVRDSFNFSMESFTAMVNDIRRRADEMNGEAGEISRGAVDLARRGESQAASLEQTAAAVEQISGNVSMTSQAACEADQLARGAQDSVLKGAEIVAQAMAAMERIDQHTRHMAKFTRVIDTFAFQTNLLSINAAVEAARAGEVGRGFAVVANEVRNLAQQSAKASQNIAELISKSETEVKTGVDLVRAAGTSLDAIRGSMSDMVQNIAGIAHATTEQATGVREVSEALSQLDNVNQANLSLSDRYANAATSLGTQIEELTQVLSAFQTGQKAAAVRSILGRPGHRAA